MGRIKIAALALGLAIITAPGVGAGQETTPPAAPQAAPASAPSPAQPQQAKPDDGLGPVTKLPLPRFVSLKSGEGNARRGPGLTHRIDWVFTAEGMPLRVTAEYENWRRVEDADGAGGWVHYSLLSSARSVLVTQDMAEFLNRPEDGARVVFQAEYGVVARLLECLPDWCRVSVDGDKGWTGKSALWGVGPAETVD